MVTVPAEDEVDYYSFNEMFLYASLHVGGNKRLLIANNISTSKGWEPLSKLVDVVGLNENRIIIIWSHPELAYFGDGFTGKEYLNHIIVI